MREVVAMWIVYRLDTEGDVSPLFQCRTRHQAEDLAERTRRVAARHDLLDGTMSIVVARADTAPRIPSGQGAAR